MKIKSVEVKNFRLLRDVTIVLDDHVTLIVGRNNSGKTSLIDIFEKFIGREGNRFKFEDFSIESNADFKNALLIWNKVQELKNSSNEEGVQRNDGELRSKVPVISLTLNIEYSDSDNLASLSSFIMDLDPDRKDVCVRLEYSPRDIEKLFEALSKESKPIDFLKKNHGRFYERKVFALDKVGESRKLIENRSALTDLVLTSFIYAQRHIDDQELQSSEKLSRCFEEFYTNHYKDQNISDEMQTLLDSTRDKWDEKYKEIFSVLLTDLKTFGYPGLNSHDLAIKSEFDVEKVLKGNTNVYYEYDADNLLPESYNGLGFKNLIYIILQFISYTEKYKSKTPTPNFHLLFIEEPEVHLHPQMQCTFIRNIKKFINSKEGWNVQIAITTHSSHIISESDFNTIRYFDSSKQYVKEKDLKNFKPEGADTLPFLRQYLTLKKCDLFFADKVIMVEGTVERLLLPLMINKLDEGKNTTFNSQYITLVEAGGAYAHKFKELLQFIGVKTLVITDLDSISTKQEHKKVPVEKGDETSNAVLKTWIPQKAKIEELLKCNVAAKIDGKIRIAYQIPEEDDGRCGRSFEEAFILANAGNLTGADSITNANLFQDKDEETVRREAFEIAEKISSKTDFAFDIMLMSNWSIPKYIKEGLEWLAEEGAKHVKPIT